MSQPPPQTPTHGAHGHEEISAQCPSCWLHELVPVYLQRGEEGLWKTLENHKGPPPPGVVQIDACPVCRGAWFDPGELNLLAGESANLESLLAAPSQKSRRRCPRGHGVMQERALPGQINTPLDHCPTCHGVWLDGYERQKLAQATTREGQQTRGKRIARRGVIWAAQLLTQLPVEVENPASGTPWVVYSLLVIVAAMFGLQIAGTIDLEACMPGAGGMPLGSGCLAPVAGALRNQWENQGPQALINGTWYTLLTYWFLHGGWAHILGNAYFLYIFGDNVEHLFGRVRFALFFLLAAVGGGLGEVLLTQNTLAPLVGASGGIAGVMAAYLWCFPRNKLFQVIMFIQVKLPAWVYLFVWVGLQALLSLIAEDAGVAWYAHLFGFAVGAALTPVILSMRRREVARAVKVPAIDV